MYLAGGYVVLVQYYYVVMNLSVFSKPPAKLQIKI